jgi:hypothetical protein
MKAPIADVRPSNFWLCLIAALLAAGIAVVLSMTPTAFLGEVIAEQPRALEGFTHPDRPYWAAASCGIADLRSPTPTPRQGSLHAHVSRTESRPMIAAVRAHGLPS